MKLYIPDIGDKITLSKDWTFDVYDERRNSQLLLAIGQKYDHYNWGKNVKYPATLPQDTILIIDRIYIRKGKNMADFSSVSFRIESSDKKFNKCRFWAKLADVNNIEFEDTKVELAERIKQLVWPSASDIKVKEYYYFHSNQSGDKELILELKNHLQTRLAVKKWKSGCKWNDPRYDYSNALFKINVGKMSLDIEKYIVIGSINESKDGGFFGYTHWGVSIFAYYKLLDNGKEIGEWKTPESLIKAAKKYYKENYET